MIELSIFMVLSKKRLTKADKMTSVMQSIDQSRNNSNMQLFMDGP